MPVPKTGALPLGDSPIPVSSPAARQENRRDAAERREVLGACQRLAREDLPAALGPESLTRARRFPPACKDSEDARAAAREHDPRGARPDQPFARAADFG